MERWRARKGGEERERRREGGGGHPFGEASETVCAHCSAAPIIVSAGTINGDSATIYDRIITIIGSGPEAGTGGGGGLLNHECQKGFFFLASSALRCSRRISALSVAICREEEPRVQ
eukprot:520112-Rhodomonas_salina.1